MLDSHVDVPVIRPKGVTAKQWRLAALYPRAESAYQALRAAGYAHSTADSLAARQIGSVGVAIARKVQDATRLDSARGLAGFAAEALAKGKDDLAALDPRDRIAAGLKATELAHNLGDGIDREGNGASWRVRIRKAMRRAYRAGYAAALRSIPPTTTD
jgi:hypothetical protein